MASTQPTTATNAAPTNAQPSARAIFNTGQTRWEHITWPYEAFQQHLTILGAHTHRNAADLYLSGAAGFRIRDAWSAIQHAAGDRAIQLLNRYRLRGCDPEDIWSDALVKLARDDTQFPTQPFNALGFQDTPAAIVRFDGRCTLVNFVILVAKRLAFDAMEKSQNTSTTSTDAIERTEADATTTPFADRLSNPAVSSALAKALATIFADLTAEDRALFSMVHLHSMTRREAADFLGWRDPSKATRHLQNIGAAIHSAVDNAVGTADLTPQDAESVMQILRRVLQADDPRPSSERGRPGGAGGAGGTVRAGSEPQEGDRT